MSPMAPKSDPVAQCGPGGGGGGGGQAEAYPPSILDDSGDGQHDVVGVDEAHGDSCVAGEGAVDGIVGQDFAVDAVSRDGGDGADEVGGIDVLDVGLFKLLLQQVPHPHPHILQNGVAALVCLLLTLGQNLLHTSTRKLQICNDLMHLWDMCTSGWCRRFEWPPSCPCPEVAAHQSRR